MAVEADMQTALNRAMDYCIENGILKEFLVRYRAEVLGMFLEEFDAEKYERTIRDEGREEGIQVGREEGREEGREDINMLGDWLVRAGRSNEFHKSLTDRKLQKELFMEFELEGKR